MSEEEQESRGFVIKDKRRFDAEGKEKGSEGAPSSDSASTELAADKEHVVQPGEKGFVASERKEPEAGSQVPVDFSSFVVSLATQALMQMGEIAPPPGISIPQDAGAAKQTIEVLTMLEEKTRGNLEQTEERLMREILDNLKMSFVKATAKK